MSRTLAFEVAGVPPSLNDWRRYHWTKRMEWTRDWKQRIGAHWLALKRPRFGRSIVTLEFRLQHGGDADNRGKLILDGLAKTFLKDDSPESILELRIRAERGKPSRVRITIEEVDPVLMIGGGQ